MYFEGGKKRKKKNKIKLQQKICYNNNVKTHVA